MITPPRSVKMFLGALASSVLIGLPCAAPAASTAQPLTINLHGDGARATQLPQYDPGVAIAVTVNDGGGGRADAVTISAAGPQGESLQTALTRLPSGTFSGQLTLADQGSWRIHLTSRTGSVVTNTSPVLLMVQAPPPSNAWQVGLAVGIGIFVAIGGGGFLLLRRFAGDASERSDAQSEDRTAYET